MSVAAILLLFGSTKKASGSDQPIGDTQPRLIAVAAPVQLPKPKPKPVQRVSSYMGNCVATLRQAGYHVPRTLNGLAGSIPVQSQTIAEGEVKVAVTTEGPVGHVVAVKKVDGKLVSVVEGNHSVGVGRIVSPSVLKGFVE